MPNNISPLFRGFKFCNFRLQDAKWNRPLYKIPSFNHTKMIPGLVILKIILINSLCDKCPYTQRKYVFFVIRSSSENVWNIKHNLYIVSSNWVTKVNNQKVNLISYVCNIQRLSYTWLELLISLHKRISTSTKDQYILLTFRRKYVNIA